MHGAWCGAHIGPGGLSTLGLGFYDPHVPPVSCVECSMQLAQLASAQLAPPGFFSPYLASLSRALKVARILNTAE